MYNKYASISKNKVRRQAAALYNRTRQELLIEQGEQVLDDLLVERIMKEGKETK